ncbi:MAG TPA: hypothetical protein VF548_13400 [Allosphingosinicella sp.]|jgi:hypothetical protein
MEAAERRVMIQCAADIVEALTEEVDAVAAAPSRAIERRSLDGSVPAWILAATVAVNALPTLYAALCKYADEGKVTKIQFGDVIIENPQPRDLEIFREKWERN